MSRNDAELYASRNTAAEKLLEHALASRGIPDYSPEERLVLAILAANRGSKRKDE